jgi:hypothetical protein
MMTIHSVEVEIAEKVHRLGDDMEDSGIQIRFPREEIFLFSTVSRTDLGSEEPPSHVAKRPR